MPGTSRAGSLGAQGAGDAWPHLEHIEVVLHGLRPLLQIRHIHAKGAHKLHKWISTLTNHAE